MIRLCLTVFLSMLLVPALVSAKDKQAKDKQAKDKEPLQMNHVYLENPPKNQLALEFHATDRSCGKIDIKGFVQTMGKGSTGMSDTYRVRHLYVLCLPPDKHGEGLPWIKYEVPVETKYMLHLYTNYDARMKLKRAAKAGK